MRAFITIYNEKKLRILTPETIRNGKTVKKIQIVPQNEYMVEKAKCDIVSEEMISI